MAVCHGLQKNMNFQMGQNVKASPFKIRRSRAKTTPVNKTVDKTWLRDGVPERWTGNVADSGGGWDRQKTRNQRFNPQRTEPEDRNIRL